MSKIYRPTTIGMSKQQILEILKDQIDCDELNVDFDKLKQEITDKQLQAFVNGWYDVQETVYSEDAVDLQRGLIEEILEKFTV